MGFFTRLSNGWEIAKTSLKVLNAHKELIIFPILSGISLTLVIGSFLAGLLGRNGWDTEQINSLGKGTAYLILFAFYIVNYFIVVFFNMGLMHCAKLYFDGEEVSVAKGLQFSLSKVGAIFSWAVFAATVGTVLKIIQDKAGWLGKIVSGFAGIAWSIGTFFVIPVIAYENVGPVDAVKRSAAIMKDKWGETIGANFSMGLVGFAGILIAGILGMTVSALINEQVGIVIFALGALITIAVSSALNSIFVSAVYNHINGDINAHFNQKLLDNLFAEQ